MQDESSQLDALVRQHIGRSGGVLKGGMRGKACRPGLGRIVAFDQEAGRILAMPVAEVAQDHPIAPAGTTGIEEERV